MSQFDTPTKAYAAFKKAQAERGLSHTDLARRLQVHQPRLSEFEHRLKDGTVSAQMKMFLKVADELGFVVKLVPREVETDVDTRIRDFEIEKKVCSKSVFDEIFVEAAEFEANRRK